MNRYEEIEEAILRRLRVTVAARIDPPRGESNILNYVDSFSFLEMVVALGAEFAIEIDLSAAEPEDFIYVGRLARVIDSQVTQGAREGNGG